MSINEKQQSGYARLCFKMVVRSVKIEEAIDFLVDSYYQLLPYIMIKMKQAYLAVKVCSKSHNYNTDAKQHMQLVINSHVIILNPSLPCT